MHKHIHAMYVLLTSQLQFLLKRHTKVYPYKHEDNYNNLYVVQTLQIYIYFHCLQSFKPLN